MSNRAVITISFWLALVIIFVLYNMEFISRGKSLLLIAGAIGWATAAILFLTIYEWSEPIRKRFKRR